MYYSSKEMKIKKKIKKPARRVMKMFPCQRKPTINFPWPNNLLLLKVSQIVGPPTFLWDWQKFAFCQSYV